jgi:hypothetical protein
MFISQSIGNIRNKLPEAAINEVLPKIKYAYYQTDKEIANLCAANLSDADTDKYPSTIKYFQEDFDVGIKHLAIFNFTGELMLEISWMISLRFLLS